MRLKKVWLVCDTSIYELPIALFETAKDCARWLGISERGLRKAIQTNAIICKNFRVEKVLI
ncbi:MAG: hypothetical protein IJ301_04410 [Clostridia bacterium]|nr:hypothetical protein [Clostridia bacterium]